MFDKFYKYAKAIAILVALAMLCVLLGFSISISVNINGTTGNLKTASATLPDVTANAKQITADASEVSGKVNTFVTPGFLANMQNNADLLVGSTTTNANAYGAVAKTFGDFMTKRLGPVADTANAKLALIGDSTNKAILDFDSRGMAQLESTTRLTNNVNDKFNQFAKSIETGLARTPEKLGQIVDKLHHAVGEFDVLISDEAWKNMVESGADAMFELTGSLGHVNSITGTFDEVTKYYKAKILPKPRTYSKNKFKAFWQKAGYVTWDVVSGGANGALLVLRFVNAIER